MSPRGLWMDLLDTSESECTKNIPLSAGKTTLLDLLAGRRIKGRISSKSEISYDGHPPTPRYKQHHVGYVEQQDTLLEMMTPYEMLMYTAQLKLSRATSKEEVKIRVQDLIEKLNLNSCQHTVIGPHLRQKISGGEAKRTNIGISMVSNPSVLYIDELTSGLDAYTGHEVARAVKGLSESGITICVSLHSPPPRTFQLFDRLLMMQKGRVLYFGCSGLEVLDYLEQNFPCLQKMEENEGVADYLLDVTNKSDDEGVTNFADAYLKSELYEQNCYIIKNRTRLPEGDIEKNETTSQISKTTSNASQDVPLYQTVEQVIPRVNPTWWALWVMWRYRTLRLWSKLSFIAPRVFEKFMIVFLITTLWW